jgi:sugar O-acyltransferase (sialic acid O-acetyltransferase NeuD family)
MAKKLIIIGAGEFALIAYEYFTHDSDYEVVAFSVEGAFIAQPTLNELPVVALETLESAYSPHTHDAFVAVTFTQLNRLRTRLYQAVKAKGFRLANYISSRAFVWRNAELGENVFIFEANVIQPFTRIGNNVILWSGNHLGHRSVIEDHCFLSSHVVISGYCVVGENSFLGVNTTVSNNIRIARDTFTRPASVIMKHTEENRIYQGNPATAVKIPARTFFKVP